MDTFIKRQACVFLNAECVKDCNRTQAQAIGHGFFVIEQ